MNEQRKRCENLRDRLHMWVEAHLWRRFAPSSHRNAARGGLEGNGENCEESTDPVYREIAEILLEGSEQGTPRRGASGGGEVEGDVDPDSRELLAHLRACASCRAHCRRTARIVRWVSGLKRFEAPELIEAGFAAAAGGDVSALEPGRQVLEDSTLAGLLRSLPRHEAPPELDQRIDQLLAGAPRESIRLAPESSERMRWDVSNPIPLHRRPAAGRRRGWRVASYAAAAALVIGLATFLLWSYDPSSGPQGSRGNLAREARLTLEYVDFEEVDPSQSRVASFLVGWAGTVPMRAPVPEKPAKRD